MQNLGYYAEGDVIDFWFTTKTTGDVPAALTGGALGVLKDNDTATETFGLTLTANFAGITGLNHVRILTAASAVYYEDESTFGVVATAGTVNAVAYAGTVVARFHVGALAAAFTQAGLDALVAAVTGGAGGSPGAGGIAYPVIIQIGGVPLAGVDVWFTTDVGGSNVIASLTTDAAGTANFLLDAGGYFMWRQKDGYNFGANPTAITVS